MLTLSNQDLFDAAQESTNIQWALDQAAGNLAENMVPILDYNQLYE